MLLALGWWGADVQAQIRYHCRDDRGNTFTLSRPCPEGTKTTAAVAGPAPAQYSSPRYDNTPARSSPETPDHHQYMSSRCRTLDENMRSGYSRGIKADVLEGMRREYRRDCREQEQDAQSRLYGERRARDKERREAEKESQLAAQASREQEERVAQQCAESRRILANKRARTDLTEGEKNDLRRFEEAFLARCKR
ncbi:MAG: hypothetical protein Q8N13_21580 [Acidovorax sp.]|nr:hypothetical protein [Acidovorax sp.]